MRSSQTNFDLVNRGCGAVHPGAVDANGGSGQSSSGCIRDHTLKRGGGSLREHECRQPQAVPITLATSRH
jgi:hypothetical protein